MRGRLERLEGRIPPPDDEGDEASRELMWAILDEVASLKACRANSSYRGGIPIQPTDPAGDALGYPYTHGELFEFAARRVLDRFDLENDPRVDDFLRSYFGQWWDEVAAEGLPEPTPPIFRGSNR